jgi:hypothetical protein
VGGAVVVGTSNISIFRFQQHPHSQAAAPIVAGITPRVGSLQSAALRSFLRHYRGKHRHFPAKLPIEILQVSPNAPGKIRAGQGARDGSAAPRPGARRRWAAVQ